MLLTLRFVFCFLTTSEETKWGLQASRLLDRLLHLLLLVHSIALLSSPSSLPPLGLRTDLDHVTMVAIECGNLGGTLFSVRFGFAQPGVPDRQVAFVFSVPPFLSQSQPLR